MKKKRCFQIKGVKLEEIIIFTPVQTKTLIESLKQAYTWVKKEKARVDYINPSIRYKTLAYQY